jgi:TonB family protein
MTQGFAMGFSGSPGTSCYDSDDEEEVYGRILTTEELIERLRFRGDFLGYDSDRRLRFTEAVSIVCAVITGLWLSKQEVNIDVPLEFLEPNLVQFGTTTFNTNKVVERPTPPAPKVINIDKSTHVSMNNRHAKSNIGGQGGKGSGSIASRVARVGIFASLSKNASKNWTGSELFAQGGFASGIDRIIDGVNGLKKGSGGSVSRAGMATIGDGPGFGPSGFDGGDGSGIDDLIGNLMAPQPGVLSLKKPRSPPMIVPADFKQGSGTFIGGRSKSSIMAVVFQNIASLRYEYNKRLRDKPGMTGNVKIRFSIDEFGKVIYCDVLESTMHDPYFEKIVSTIISRWRFEKINKPGDITEIIYPFAFSS